MLPRISRDQSASAGLYLNWCVRVHVCVRVCVCACVCVCVRVVEQYSETGHNLISAKTFLASEETIYTRMRRFQQVQVTLKTI